MAVPSTMSTCLDPYEQQLSRRVAARAPLGLVVFVVSVGLSALFEFLRFPDRRGWMATFAGGFAVLAALMGGLIRRWPRWSIGILVAGVNLVGVAINAYHAIVGGSIPMCVLVLTALLAAST